jgi:hypothetical protein
MMVAVAFAVVMLVLALYWLHTVPTPQLLRIRHHPSLQERRGSPPRRRARPLSRASGGRR